MKKKPFLLVLCCMVLANALVAQQLTFRKGMITDSISVGDSIPETFSVYLPTSFEARTKWPVLFVFDMQGKARQALGMFRDAAEQKGYLLAASNNVNDSLSISENILITTRMINRVNALVPVHEKRMYTAGFASGAQLAALVPSFIKEVNGVISIGASIPNAEILDANHPFYFLGMVGIGDFNYPAMLDSREALDRKNFPNHLLVFEGVQEWPDTNLLKLGMDLLALRAMAEGTLPRDMQLAKGTYEQMMARVQALIGSGYLYNAYDALETMQAVFSPFSDFGSLEEQIKDIRKNKQFRSQRRDENAILFQEGLKRDDFIYYLEEDILTYNFNNLGWWSYQMEGLEKQVGDSEESTRHSGQRLKGFLNALIEDQIDVQLTQKSVDEEALLFLWMLKTITEPRAYAYYLKIISMSSKYEDYGTALFYLEELLKNGYEDKAALYALENTALLRITPEYNSIINKYLKGARYELIEE